MQIAIAALPLFDGRFDRALIYILLRRRTLDGALPTPVLAISESLGIPFETTRRHVTALADDGLCRRTRGGIIATPVAPESTAASFADLSHDVFVRFLIHLRAIGGLPPYPLSTRSYDRCAGQQVCADLVLSLMHTSAVLFRDRLDLILHATVLAANTSRINADVELSRLYAVHADMPPSRLLRPIRVRRISQLLGLSEATVRRRLQPRFGETFHNTSGGLLIDEAWIGSVPTMDAVDRSAGDVRRALGALASHGFPFHDIPSAYRRGPPPTIAFG